MSSVEPLESEHLKYVPQKTEYTAYGFIREFQSTIDQIIAELIYKISLAFYAEIDRWNANKMSNLIEFNHDTQTIKNISTNTEHANDWQTAYGETLCKHPNIYHWKLKIDKLRGNKEIMIGVIYDTLDITLLGDLADDGAFVFWSRRWGTCCYESATYRNWDYGQILKDGDIIDITLDLKSYTLSFMINNKSYGVALGIPRDKAYHFAVSLGDKDNQVTLL